MFYREVLSSCIKLQPSTAGKLQAFLLDHASSLPVRITRNEMLKRMKRHAIKFLFSGGFRTQVTVHLLRALLLAAQPVPSFLARLRAIGTFPTPGADATSGRGVTRTIVHAFAVRVTIHAVKTLRALCFASDSCFDVKKQNPSRESILRSRRFGQLPLSYILYLSLAFCEITLPRVRLDETITRLMRD